MATTSPASSGRAPRIAGTRAVRASIATARVAATPVTSPSPSTTGTLPANSRARVFAGLTNASEDGR